MWSPLRRGELTLAAKVLLLQLTVIVTLLVAVGVLSIRQSNADFAEERGAQMRNAAEYVAGLPVVRGELDRVRHGEAAAGGIPSTLAPYLEWGIATRGAQTVTVVSVDGVVLAATDPSRVGDRAALGSSDALEGRGWSGDVAPDGHPAVAAHVPVISEADGALLAIVTAEVEYPTLADQVATAAPDLGLFLGLGALLGLIGTWFVSRVVRRSTRGLGTTELANLADHREALLHAIREGVVGVGTDGRVTAMNDAARTTLGLDAGPDPVGRHVDDLGLDPHVVALLTGEGADVRDALALVGTRVVVFNRGRASSGGRGIGTVTTLRDRTELVSLQSQLSSNLSITDTLRAQTHEFDNRLHTISGLVQLGEYDELAALVGTLTRRRAEIEEYVAKRLADPAVAALVLAKHAVAEERGVTLELDPGSRLGALEPGLGADLTTVLGNLVDNAVDACAGHRDATVEVWLHADDEAVHLRVRDTGPGIAPELRDTVFVRGFSTKDHDHAGVVGGRGIGLALVRLICTQRGGTVVVDDADPGSGRAGGGGAEFRVVLPLRPVLGQDGAP
ncbi:sensor histidine kinase [Pimelobacter simplex]|uniref:histidine kinase n=1 Tax=Nocardioides simplex TaxID=2045 RepID=A0A0A1DHG6_NOCSI|nr:ATP-binding protein [Pimelobacter simplex]AIY16749.2 Signal transduction histidine kinase CitA regulating citrate metabolism [Pimelobacter simplex]GEB15609.1 ATPase [Pimelobacter simplex]SFM57666.1 signal transduction histidine kinase regulating citrate/malate metabolism [Pimelobacter simplex]